MNARILMILVAMTGLCSLASGAPSFAAPDTAELNEEQVLVTEVAWVRSQN